MARQANNGYGIGPYGRWRYGRGKWDASEETPAHPKQHHANRPQVVQLNRVRSTPSVTLPRKQGVA